MTESNHKASDGDDRYEKLYRRYRGPLIGEACKVLHDYARAEDAAQITFEKVYRHLDQIEDEGSGRTWNYLDSILMNVCFSILRKEKRLVPMEDEVLAALHRGREMEDLADAYVEKMDYRLLLKQVNDLPEIYRNALILNAVYEYSSPEIAKKLHMSPETIRKRIERGRKLLREIRGA